ncbi:MAG: protease complex subunit PrcB family protein [Lachnospiraceae bacterium]
MKPVIGCLVGICFTIVITGCSIKESKTEKLRDLEFTVVEKESLPDELLELIEEKKEKPMKLTYGDKKYCYIVKGYGSQKTSGYSIEITDLYETQNAIYIHTNLLGPASKEKVERIATFPYVVAKIESNKKNLIFD